SGARVSPASSGLIWPNGCSVSALAGMLALGDADAQGEELAQGDVADLGLGEVSGLENGLAGEDRGRGLALGRRRRRQHGAGDGAGRVVLDDPLSGAGNSTTMHLVGLAQPADDLAEDHAFDE